MKRLAIVLALCACTEIPAPEAPKNVQGLQKAIDDTCRGMLALCSVYEMLPAEARNEDDDASCLDARVFCAPPEPAVAP